MRAKSSQTVRRTRSGARLLVGGLAGALALVLSGAPIASAWDGYPEKGAYHRYTYGVHGQKLWLAQSAVNNNKAAILDGVALWNGTPTPVSFSRTYTKSESRLDFYNIGYFTGFCAATTWRVDTNTVNPYRANWWWAKVEISDILKINDACGPAWHRKALLAHEQGHAMGLAHPSSGDPSVLMYRRLSDTTVNQPKQDDINGINYLY